LTAITLSQSSTSICVHFVSCSGANSAALFTRTSILPNRSIVAATSIATELSSLTSVTVVLTEFAPCLADISRATSSPSTTSAIITRAPSAANAKE
jgi:hypothetical protein